LQRLDIQAKSQDDKQDEILALLRQQQKLILDMQQPIMPKLAP